MAVARWRGRQTREQKLDRWLRSSNPGFASGEAANPMSTPPSRAAAYAQAKGQAVGAPVLFGYDKMTVT